MPSSMHQRPETGTSPSRSHPATYAWPAKMIRRDNPVPIAGRTWFRDYYPLHKSSVAQTDPVMNARCVPADLLYV